MNEKFQQLLHAVQTAYRKHCLGDDSVGWDELGDLLADTLCEVMGDEQFQEWINACEERH